MGGQCDACGESQVEIQLCYKCVVMWEEKFKKGETMQRHYFNDGMRGKELLSPTEYRKMNKNSRKKFK